MVLVALGQTEGHMGRLRDSADEFAFTMAEVARELMQARTVTETLVRVSQLCVETVPGCDHAGVLLVRGEQVQTLASTSQLVVDSDRAQGELREGPCYDAARDATWFRVVHMGAEKRWPRYAPRARELGIGAMMGFQLFTDSDQLGALDMYADQPYGFTAMSEQLAWIFASHATVAVAASRAGDQLRLSE